ncbi:MAG TPA: hypothetical protein VGF84_16630 [Micromonosporaceae bacterium]|jgi:hypothetical protein
MGVEDSEWARQRTRAIKAHAADLERREAADAEQARQMLLEFVEAMRAQATPPTSLVARSFDGRHRYRTGLHGWYLRADNSIAVDEEGQFYILSVRGSLRALVSGATVVPSRPRLIMGEGGRDGERISLRELLDRRIAT